jgi:hypothetical protein
MITRFFVKSIKFSSNIRKRFWVEHLHQYSLIKWKGSAHQSVNRNMRSYNAYLIFKLRQRHFLKLFGTVLWHQKIFKKYERWWRIRNKKNEIDFHSIEAAIQIRSDLKIFKRSLRIPGRRRGGENTSKCEKWDFQKRSRRKIQACRIKINECSGDLKDNERGHISVELCRKLEIIFEFMSWKLNLLKRKGNRNAYSPLY